MVYNLNCCAHTIKYPVQSGCGVSENVQHLPFLHRLLMLITTGMSLRSGSIHQTNGKASLDRSMKSLF